MENPNIILFFLNIAGSAALLIWSVRLVRTGVERAFSVQLRLWLRRSAKSKILSTVMGMTSAILLQSATAVAILTSNFVSGGAITGTAGLAILLGADVGSAIVVQLLTVRYEFLIPTLLLVGVGLFLRGQQRQTRQIGRILIGLALIFVSLDMIRLATAPLVENTGTASIMAYLARDPVTAFVIGALFAWIVHSSVAAVLLFVTLVSQGLMPQSAAIAMVLGANLGGAVIAYVLTLSAPLEARRMIVSNLFIRGGGAALLLVALTALGIPLMWLGASEAQRVLNLHLVFNIGVTVLALPVLTPIMRLTTTLMKPSNSKAAMLGRATALDSAVLDEPDRALSCATREIIHMGETIEAMLRSINPLFHKWNESQAESIAAGESSVRKMHFEIKLFLAKLNRGALDEEQSSKSLALSTLAVNLEAAADTIARNMIALARRLDVESVRFSDDGSREISDFHDRVLSNVQLALNVVMTQNPDDARELVAEKESVRNIEQNLQRRHLGRLQDGLTESIETSNIHQEALRALKQINTAFSMVAHPILLERGDLLESRLSNR